MRLFFKYVVALIIVLGLLAIGFIYAANARDEPLSEETKALLAYQPPTEEQLRDNGYLIIMGLDAPVTDGDPVASAVQLGRQRLEREIERKQWFDNGGLNKSPNDAPSNLKPEKALGTKDILPEDLRCDTKAGINCHNWYVENALRIKGFTHSQQAILRRTEVATLSPKFANYSPMYLWMEFPPYTSLIRAHELQLAKASLLWNDGEQEQALLLVRQSHLLTRRVATSSDQLIASMIALAMQYQTQIWFADVVASTKKPITPKALALANQTLEEPIFSLLTSFSGEARFQASMHYVFQVNRKERQFFLGSFEGKQSLLDSLSTQISDLAYLPNETINHQIAWWQLYLPTTNVPAHEYDAALAELEVKERQLRDKKFNWFGARNFWGNVLLNMAKPSYSNYVQRRHDVDGHRRTVLLLLQAKSQKVRDDQMTDWLAKSPENLHNPYTLEPMQWDAATRSLVFEGREANPRNPESSKTYRVKF